MLQFQVLQGEETDIQSKCVIFDTSQTISSLAPAQECGTAGIVSSDCISGVDLKLKACHAAPLDMNSTKTETVQQNEAHPISAVDTDIFRIREPICPGKYKCNHKKLLNCVRLNYIQKPRAIKL